MPEFTLAWSDTSHTRFKLLQLKKIKHISDEFISENQAGQVVVEREKNNGANR